MREELQKDSGQSTIEFLVSFSFVIGFMFLYLKMALNMTNGYLVHYATFMASRAYLTADNNSNDPAGGDPVAATRAREVFGSFFVEDFINSTGGSEVEFTVNDPNYGGNLVFVGGIASYNDKFSPTPVLGGGEDLNFVSEAFLGREPTRSECTQRICSGFEEAGASGCLVHVTIMDNGC